MIPSSRKVGKSLFKSLMEKGKSFYSESFSARVFLSGTSELARFSVVVAKKLEKSAVKRNQIKRRTYSLLRPHLATAKIGSLCVFFIKKKIGTKSLPALRIEIETVLRKAKIL